MLCVDLRLDRQSVGLWGWEMDTYSLPLQTVKLICNTDNISTGAGPLGRLGHSRDDRCHTCHKIINYFLHFKKKSKKKWNIQKKGHLLSKKDSF